MNVVSYLQNLTPAALEQLYANQWTTQAVLRALPPLSRLYIMRLLHVADPVRASISIPMGLARPAASGFLISIAAIWGRV